MMPNRTDAASRRGFTLTELMTVVSILSTILAILLPTIVRIVQWNRKQTETALIAQHLDRLREAIERDIERVESVDAKPDGDAMLRGKGFEVLYRRWDFGIAREEVQPPAQSVRREFYRLPSGLRLQWNPNLDAWLNDRTGPIAIGRLERTWQETASAKADVVLRSESQWLQWRAIGGHRSFALWERTDLLGNKEAAAP